LILRKTFVGGGIMDPDSMDLGELMEAQFRSEELALEGLEMIDLDEETRPPEGEVDLIYSN
jgi:hypothetical protein